MDIDNRMEEVEKAIESLPMMMVTKSLESVVTAGKRWFVLCMIILGLWFSTIGIFVWYLSQYDIAVTTANTNAGGNAIVGGGGDITIGEGD